MEFNDSIYLPQVPPVSVTYDGFEFTIYDSKRDSTAPPIVLVPRGAQTAGADYWALFPMLASRHRVITFTAGTEAAGNATKLGLDAVLNELGEGAALHLLGFAEGASAATELASRLPARILTLSLVAGRYAPDARTRLQELVQAAELDTEAKLALDSLLAFSPNFINTRPEKDIRALTQRVQGAASAAPWISSLPGTVSTPTLVIGCEHDAVSPIRQSQLLFGAIPDARFASVQAGHHVLTERPSEVFDLIDRFVIDPANLPSGTILENSHS